MKQSTGIILLFITILTALIFKACNDPKQAGQEILNASNSLLESQNAAVADSVLTEDEISDLIEQRTDLRTLLKSTLDDMNEKERVQVCKYLASHMYETERAWKQSNRHLFYPEGGSEYFLRCKKFKPIYQDCKSWRKLASRIFFTSIRSTAQQAMSVQYDLARKQVRAAQDGVITDEEIDTIIQAFNRSMGTYQQIYDSISGNDKLMNEFEKELADIEQRFAEMNKADRTKLAESENYDKLKDAMEKAMYTE
ncbi:MAG: hypothetical protein ACLFM1_10590 [Bacteroidales bacterium]